MGHALLIPQPKREVSLYQLCFTPFSSLGTCREKLYPKKCMNEGATAAAGLFSTTF